MTRHPAVLLCVRARLQAAAAAAAREAKVLNVFTWPDYIAPNTIADFEKEYGIKVNYDTYDSTEMAEARLLAGRTGYDVVVHAERYSARLIPIGIYRPLDKSKLTNWKNLDPWVLEDAAEPADPGNRYGVPYLWGTTGFTYNVKMIRERMPDAPVDSADMIFKPEVAKHFADCGITFLDEPTDVIPMVMAVPRPRSQQSRSRRSRGSRGGAEERTAVHPLLQLGEDADRPAERGGLHRDELVGRLRAGDVPRQAGRAGRSILPTRRQGKERWRGSTCGSSPRTRRIPDNAHLFLNYLLRPEVIAAISNETRYAAPNFAAAAVPAAGSTRRPCGLPARRGRDSCTRDTCTARRKNACARGCGHA